MDTIYLAYMAGLVTIPALVLLIKALRRVPADLRSFFTTLTSVIRN